MILNPFQTLNSWNYCHYLFFKEVYLNPNKNSLVIFWVSILLKWDKLTIFVMMHPNFPQSILWVKVLCMCWVKSISLTFRCNPNHFCRKPLKFVMLLHQTSQHLVFLWVEINSSKCHSKFDRILNSQRNCFWNFTMFNSIHLLHRMKFNLSQISQSQVWCGIDHILLLNS